LNNEICLNKVLKLMFTLV